MTPHVPNTSGSSIRSGPSHTGQRSKRNSGGHSSINNHNSNIDTSNSSSIAAMNLSGIDKKRPRALEESPQSSRKKIAGELMAFQFQSLSLSNADGSSLVEGAVSSGFLPQLHLPVQQQTRHEEQRQQQLEPSQQQFQHQRSRAVSSPVVSEVVSETTLRKGAPLLAVAVSSDSSSSNYSPLPLHITPPPVTSAATLDLSMLMDEGRGGNTVALSQNLGQGVARNSSASSSSSSTALSTVKVLSLRQRKWNSVSKEWQEWQEVEATHTPDLPSALAEYTTQIHLTDSGSNGSSSSSPQPNGIEPRHTVGHDGAHSWVGTRGKETSSEWSLGSSGQSNGLGRQRSFHEQGERPRQEHGDNISNQEPRSSYGARARSFSETNIHPYTQQHQQQLYHLQDPPMHTESPSPLYQMPVPQRASHILAQADTNQQYYQPDQSSHQPLRHFGHPPRHHSDHVYLHHESRWERNDDGEAGFSRQVLQPQAHQTRARHRQSSPGPNHQHHQQAWMSLSMTALDGSTNVQRDWGLPSSTSALAPVSVSAPSAPQFSVSTSYITSSPEAREEAFNWNQQLLMSQSGHREIHSAQKHVINRMSPAQPGQHYHQQPVYHHHLHHIHHLQHGHSRSQEDVSMGEETVRLIPSRSSSPTPCLSMAPTVPRPLSVSFSHLAGLKMLGDLTEQEHDDDMEL